MIAAEGVCWKVGGAQILDDVSLSVGAGELLGIIGPNGAGKSSFVNILSGVTRPTSGRITLQDKDVTRATSTSRARMGLARSFQTSALFDGLTAGENVRLAVQAALVSEPSVLVLDEPSGGSVRRGRRRPHRDHRGGPRRGVALAMVEHHMHVILGLADRIAVLHHGQLLAVGAPDHVTADERVQQAYLGEAL